MTTDKEAALHTLFAAEAEALRAGLIPEVLGILAGLRGPLDYTVIQSAGHVLHDQVTEAGRVHQAVTS